jgi:hypothetical protein
LLTASKARRYSGTGEHNHGTTSSSAHIDHSDESDESDESDDSDESDESDEDSEIDVTVRVFDDEDEDDAHLLSAQGSSSLSRPPSRRGFRRRNSMPRSARIPSCVDQHINGSEISVDSSALSSAHAASLPGTGNLTVEEAVGNASHQQPNSSGANQSETHYTYDEDDEHEAVQHHEEIEGLPRLTRVSSRMG